MPTDKRRLLHLIPNMLNGGSQRQLAYLAREQARRGWQVAVAFAKDGPSSSLLAGSGVEVLRFAERRSLDARLVIEARRFLRYFRPEIIQTWLPQMDVVGGIAARWARVPWILSERSSALAYDRNVKNRLRERVANGAAAIVANSSGGLAFWKGRVSEHVTRYVIPNIVPVQEIDGTTPIEDRAIGLPPGCRLILSVASFSPLKNVPNVVHAVGRVSSRIDCRAYLCGDGTHPESVEEAIRSAGIAHRVTVLGLRNDVWRWMRRADVLVSVSVVEGQPNAVLEAMAAGCPVVLSDIPAHREIADEACAVFVDPKSVESIAKGITATLEDERAARARAERARDRVLRLSAGDAASRFEEVYRLARPGKRDSGEGNVACAG